MPCSLVPRAPQGTALPERPHAGAPVGQSASRRCPQGLAGAPRWLRNESGAWSRPFAADGTSGHGRPPADGVGKFRHPGKVCSGSSAQSVGYELVCRSAWAAATGIHACQDGNPIIPHTVQLRRAQAQDDSSWSYLLQEDHKIRAARCMKPVLTFAHFRPLQRPKLKDQTQPEVRRSTLLMVSQTVA